MNFIKITDLDLFGKRVLIRSDLNVPIKNGKITSNSRIIAAVPTIKAVLAQGALVMVTSHLGRPIEGKYDTQYSLKLIINNLMNYISSPIRLIKNYLDGIDINKGELLVLENVRFNKGEKDNSIKLSKKYAKLCDIFVMDAFGAAHRMEASTYGIMQFAPVSCAGLLLCEEINMLNKILYNPVRPMTAIVSGSKVSTKLKLLHSLSNIADKIIVGGGIANTFIAAQGHNVGSSLYEPNLIEEAKTLLQSGKIIVPTDVRVSTKLFENSIDVHKSIYDIKENEYILDLGDYSISYIINIIKKSKTVVWNGPVGVFEFSNFKKGTNMIALAIADSTCFSIVGGGDTLAALNCFGVIDKISYISTGGGAFLEFLIKKKLPALCMLAKYKYKS